jgi:phosphosulfolactate phosphohydrolase-like enzyme
VSAVLEFNHRIHVLTRKKELDTVRVPGKVVVVLDILFAITTMATALAHGATEMVPVADAAAARGLAREVEFACRFDAFPVVPALEAGTLRLVA